MLNHESAHESFLTHHRTSLSVIALIFLFTATVGYGEYRHMQLADSLAAVKSEFASTTSALQDSITVTEHQLTDLQNQNNQLSGAVADEQNNRAIYTATAGQIANVVGTLDKLSKTDPQLLQKYSKVYFLNENYAPAALATITPDMLYYKTNPLQANAQVMPYLQRLFAASKQAGLNLSIISAYRSFKTQSVLKSSYKVTYGAGTANSFSADQGYSEHQLGTAFDFTTPTVADTFNNFEKTPEYTWLSNNAYQYGFILSYPPNNSYYVSEPWHWRFVGIDLATRLHTEGKNFYDYDQRTINNYLSVLFD